MQFKRILHRFVNCDRTMQTRALTRNKRIGCVIFNNPECLHTFRVMREKIASQKNERKTVHQKSNGLDSFGKSKSVVVFFSGVGNLLQVNLIWAEMNDKYTLRLDHCGMSECTVKVRGSFDSVIEFENYSGNSSTRLCAKCDHSALDQNCGRERARARLKRTGSLWWLD